MTPTHIIDAAGKRLGRVASEAASLLMGKNLPTYVRNAAPDVKVTVINCGKTRMDAKKKADSVYVEFTGFRGGLNEVAMSKLIAEKGYVELYERAIYGMLPHNKLKKGMMKNLTLTE